jgi:flagellar basal-body rod protein FlgF
MNYGLYLSAAGTLASLHRQDVLANNLANIATVGFKPDQVDLRARMPERIENPSALIDEQDLLERLGGGEFSRPTRVGLRQGDLAQSTNDLDLAIEGEGFFVVQSGRGVRDEVRFTRDGRFTLNAAGELIMTATGLRVLDVNDQPIQLNRGAKIRINGDGTIFQNNAAAGQLQIATVTDTSKLAKQGASLLKADAKRQAATGLVRQHFVESSAVDPIMALNAMINASKAVQANATMMQYHDNLLGQAINTLGRVS